MSTKNRLSLTTSRFIHLPSLISFSLSFLLHKAGVTGIFWPDFARYCLGFCIKPTILAESHWRFLRVTPAKPFLSMSRYSNENDLKVALSWICFITQKHDKAEIHKTLSVCYSCSVVRLDLIWPRSSTGEPTCRSPS